MTPGVRRHTFRVPEELSGSRLDQVIAALVPELSRRRARVAIDLGAVFVDGRRIKVASRKLSTGQNVEVVIGGAFERATKQVGSKARLADEAELPPPKVLFEDADLVVIDKPAGLLTAPTPESDRNNALSVLQSQGRERLWVVHRLDIQTSGVMVLAASEEANRVLSETFRTHDVERRYLTIVEGAWPAEQKKIEEPVEGRSAVTDFEVAERLPGATLLQATLYTGRNHQIRRHTSSVGFPVAGDRKYGASRMEPAAPRVALHATFLGLDHPRSGERLEFEVPLPKDLTDWLQVLRRGDGR